MEVEKITKEREGDLMAPVVLAIAGKRIYAEIKRHVAKAIADGLYYGPYNYVQTLGGIRWRVVLDAEGGIVSITEWPNRMQDD